MVHSVAPLLFAALSAARLPSRFTATWGGGLSTMNREVAPSSRAPVFRPWAMVPLVPLSALAFGTIAASSAPCPKSVEPSTLDTVTRVRPTHRCPTIGRPMSGSASTSSSAFSLASSSATLPLHRAVLRPPSSTQVTTLMKAKPKHMSITTSSTRKSTLTRVDDEPRAPVRHLQEVSHAPH